MKPVRRKPKYCLIAIGAVLLALMAQPALAVTKQWVVSSGNWTTVNNWSSPGQPALNDDASLTNQNLGTSRAATLNTVTPQLGTVTVDATPTGTFTLNQSSSSTALNANAEFIGLSGKGVYNQSAGKNNVANYLVLGVNPGSNGTYNMSGGTLTTGALQVGNAGTGTFKQSSTTVNIGSGVWDQGQPFSLIVGGILNTPPGPPWPGTGTYTMSSGTLNVTGGEAIGQTGTGTFTQSSGTHKIGGRLEVGVQGGSTGIFTLSSGSLSVGGFEVIGDVGTGTFTQSSGSHTITGDLDIGMIGKGTFKMSSGSLSVGGDEYIGRFGGTGSFTQSSGSHTVAGNFTMADQPGTSATYTMSSGSLTVGGAEIIGNNGPATFTQTSGSNKAKTITIAANAPATYNLNSGSITATDPALDAIHVKGPYTPTSVSDPTSTTGGNFLIKGAPTVNGNVTNDGLIKTTSATVTWNGVVTNNSAYISDPGSTQTFNKDLVVSSTGYLVSTSTPTGTHPDSTPLDLFIFKNDFVNQSTQNTKFNTLGAEMKFVTGTDATPTDHNLYIPGAAGGIKDNNFSWHTMDITGQTITLFDGSPGTVGGSLYLYEGLIGAVISGNTITNIISNDPNGLNIYYDSLSAVNAYLGGFDYNLAGTGGGNLIHHTPLPPSVLLLGSGLLGLGALGWRRKRQG